MKQDRIEKWQSIARKIIGEHISQFHGELIEDFWIITVISTKISSDLSYMDAYVSCLKNEDTLTKSLAEIAPNIQRVLAKKIDFLRVPKLRFRYDDGGKNSFDIYNQIQSLQSK